MTQFNNTFQCTLIYNLFIEEFIKKDKDHART